MTVAGAAAIAGAARLAIKQTSRVVVVVVVVVVKYSIIELRIHAAIKLPLWCFQLPHIGCAEPTRDTLVW